MGEVLFVLICVNSFIFSFIFWGLTLFLRFLYSSKTKKKKYEFYECGFIGSNNITIQVSLSFSILMLFYILYDLEFVGFFVYTFFANITDLSQILIFIIFFFLLLLCLVIDYALNALEAITKSG